MNALIWYGPDSKARRVELDPVLPGRPPIHHGVLAIEWAHDERKAMAKKP